MVTYRDFINDVVDEVAKFNTSPVVKAQFIRHITPVLGLYEKTFNTYPITLRKSKNGKGFEAIPVKKAGHGGIGGLWFFPWKFGSKWELYEKQREQVNRDEFIKLAKPKMLDFWYVLLACIHDGEKQGLCCHRRIYFNWEDKVQTPENMIGFSVWFEYVKKPLKRQLYPALPLWIRCADTESHYRDAIQEAMRVVRADLQSLVVTGKHIAPKGEWSKPMTKKQMMTALHIDTYELFATYCKDHPIQQVGGSRQLWIIRLDTMNEKDRFKLEKA